MMSARRIARRFGSLIVLAALAAACGEDPTGVPDEGLSRADAAFLAVRLSGLGSGTVDEGTAGFEAALREGYGPEVVADHIIDGIVEDRFYILPAQPEILAMVDDRFQGLLDRRNPSPR